MNEAHIRCEGLFRTFTSEGVEARALQGLELQIARGELVALVGASGSGKSTLLNILAGLDKPTAGAAVVAGHDLLTMGRRERVAYQRHTVGFVWQETSRNLLPYLTAAENITVPMVVARHGRSRQRRERVDELLELIGIEHARDRRPADLSVGEQQRVAIATALANSPEVLLADEPTGELDQETSHDVLTAIEHANAELGVTALVVTHDPFVAGHARRSVQIRDGRTFTEALRRKEVDDHGENQHVAEEFAVVDRVGRSHPPRESATALDIREQIRLARAPDHIGVWPDAARRNGEAAAQAIGTETGDSDE